MRLCHAGLGERAAWEGAGIALPGYDWGAMRAATREAPTWVHFGAGNLFRGFIAVLQQRLLNAGLVRGGILAAETFDRGIIDGIYAPHDCMALLVGLKPDGGTQKEVVASVAAGLWAGGREAAGWGQLAAAVRHPGLQLMSFTITEKGYALRDMQGAPLPAALADEAAGPGGARHVMGLVAALLLLRYEAGAAPLALVSMDNCSRNGERLRAAVLEMARAWQGGGFVAQGFVDYVADAGRISFPWTMIDKITPRPAKAVAAQLAELGVEGMAPLVTGGGTHIAPFVNAEIPQYLVVEDSFPNGRPPLERAGVYLGDRATVARAERMKVCTCLNPLHTALAVYGCLLGYESIAAEMADPLLRALVERIGYGEGLPVAADPGIISPRAFLQEVITRRLPNPYLPDTPQRIATDTSQKIPVRFGETLKAYVAGGQSPGGLVGIPLAIAGWLRYLLGVDDAGRAMEVSPDPLLGPLQGQLAGVCLGQPDSAAGRLEGILANPALFGVHLRAAGLAGKVEAMLGEMLAGPGAVRATLAKYLVAGGDV